ncbi:hypothetical protein [Streptacidiphilus sp. BW17]|uniref:hypothetical protein n=1 Tax=Streptacidiphilus sp. BW17 TaxID=3156274 RepID=UPI003513F91B
MARFGHSTTRAALIHQHDTEERQRAIADALNARIVDGMKRGPGRNGHAGGTQRARRGSRSRNEDRPQSSDQVAELGPILLERATGIEPA